MRPNDPRTPKDPRLTGLRRNRALALSFLAAALLGLALSHAMGANGGWAWLKAFCEAAAVGALADWFAVVALFRHPLGLRFPHTAIIPNRKAHIADSLAGFVRDHFLDPETLLAKLKVFDPATRLSGWLSEPAQVKAWVSEGRRWALGTLDAFDDERMKRAVSEMVVAQLQRWDSAGTVGEVLGLLTQHGRHQALFDSGLKKLGELAASDEVKTTVAALLLKHITKEWPLVVGAIGKVYKLETTAGNFAERLSESALSELGEVLAQPAHPLRLRYEAWLQHTVRRLGNDADLRRAFEDIKGRTLDDPAVGAYLSSLWGDIKQRLRDDLARSDSAIGQRLESAFASFGARLAQDPSLREAINDHILSSAAHLVTQLRSGVTGHISQTIKAWDDAQLVREMELSVGADLQFIRMSGTLVGGVAGLVLHAASQVFQRF